MAQFVGGSGDGYAAVEQVFFQQVIDGAGAEAAAAFADEEWAGMDPGLLSVFLNGFDGWGADGAETFFATFPEDADGVAVGIDVFDVEGDQFGKSQAGGVEEFEDGGIAGGGPGGCLFGFGGGGGRGVEQCTHLVDGEDDGQFFLQFRELHGEQWVDWPFFPSGQE